MILCIKGRQLKEADQQKMFCLRHMPFLIWIYFMSEARNRWALIVLPPVNYLGAPRKWVLSSICLKKWVIRLPILHYINFHGVSIFIFIAFSDFFPKLLPSFYQGSGYFSLHFFLPWGTFFKLFWSVGISIGTKECDNPRRPDVNSKSVKEMRQEIVSNL